MWVLSKQLKKHDDAQTKGSIDIEDWVSSWKNMMTHILRVEDVSVE